MSVTAVDWAYTQPGLSVVAKAVLVKLAHHANHEGMHSYPAIRTIADHVGCVPNTVRAQLDKLETLGLIVVHRPPKQGRGRFNQYAVVLDGSARSTWEQFSLSLGVPTETHPTLGITDDKGCSPAPERVQSGAGKGAVQDDKGCNLTDTELPPELERNKPTTSGPVDNAPKGQPFEAEFAACWAIYPRKTNRAGAFKAFQARRRSGAKQTDLVLATDAYARSRVGEDQTYTLHGATFYGPGQRWLEWRTTAEALANPTPAQVTRTTCPECHGSTWQPGAGITSPLDPTEDRCTHCSGSGKIESAPPTDLEPF